MINWMEFHADFGTRAISLSLSLQWLFMSLQSIYRNIKVRLYLNETSLFYYSATTLTCVACVL